MGFFSKILGTDLKSNAINITTNLLKHQVEYGFMNDDPRTIAIQLVNNVWTKAPDVFEGKFGQSPFKLTVAIYALVKGYELYPKGGTKTAILTSIGNAFSEIQMNGAKYPLNSLDQELLQEADIVSTNIMEEVQESPEYKEMSKINNDKESRELLNELNNYLKELKNKNDEQIAVRLAFALITREGLLSKDKQLDDVLNGSNQNEIIKKDLLNKLALACKVYQERNSATMNNAANLWITTLLSYNNKETIKACAKIWSFLHTKEHLVSDIFDTLEEDGFSISQSLRDARNYTPLLLK